MATTHAWDGMSHDMRDVGAITRAEPAHQAYLALWVAYIALPLVVGLDKLTGFLNVNWEGYLATWVNDIVPGSAADAMMMVGVVELAAAVCVAVAPRIGGYIVAAWLAGIIVNLFSMGNYNDIALRDIGLLVGAIALARLATTYHGKEIRG
ncbi:MAG TPA: hypothetical protein VFY58_05865 [Nocardioides sp.]|nr:hypothetical protein [Nocardioides sp.]